MSGTDGSGGKGGGRLAGRALLISGPILLSRLLAVVREQMVAALLGAGAAGQAFELAFRIPNLARDLFAEGALSAAFVPVFAEASKNEGRAAAFRLANAMVGLVLVVVGSVALLGILCAAPIVSIFPFADPRAGAMAVPALRILFPFLPTLSLAAVAMGQLNAEERFVPPALAPAVFNLVSIAAGAVLLWTKTPPETAFLWWSGAMLAGGLAQLGVQVPVLWRMGYRPWPRLDLRDARVRRILHLMAPAVLGVAAMNVNVLVNTFFATQEDGAIVWLSKAFRLIYLPIGVFGIAIATLATTRVAQRAAARDMPGLRSTLDEGLRLVAYLTIPSAVGLIALREGVVRLLYEYGKWEPFDTSHTAAALLMYALGLYAFAAVKVVAPAFYALDHPRAPLLASVSAVTVNIVLNVVLFPIMGFAGLAIGTAIAALVNITVLLIAFRHLAGGLRVGPLAGHLTRVVAAALLCGVVAAYVHAELAAVLGTAAAGARAGAVLAAVGAGGVVYAAAGRALRLPELSSLLGVFRRGRTSSANAERRG